MARLKWDETTEKLFECGCSNGVCYTNYDKTTKKYTVGLNWNGISGFTDNPSGADEQASYADNIKYISLRGAENYGGTIKCFTFPDNFYACLGKKKPTVAASGSSAPVSGVTVSQQAREGFGFCVITKVGNDDKGTDYAETMHLVWSATTSPSSKDYSSLNESPSPSELSFEFTATASPVGDGTIFKPSCNLEINTAGMTTDELALYAALKDVLFGSDTITYDAVPESAEAPTNWAADVTAGKYYTKSGNDYVVVPSGTSWSSTTTYYTANEQNAELPSLETVLHDYLHAEINTVAEG